MRSLIGGTSRGVAQLLGGFRNATSSVPPAGRRSVAPGVASMFTGQASTAALAAYGQSSTLFPIVNRLANATSSVTWRLYRTSATGRQEDRVEVLPGQHLAASLWATPNNFYTRQEFVESFQQHLELVGEAYWVIDRNPSMREIPLGMWPVRPDRMEPVPSTTEYLAGYYYTAPSGERVPLRLDEVIQLKMPNPMDPYRGIGPVQAAMVDLDSARYSAEWNRAFFLNGAHPSGVLTTPESLNDDEFDQIATTWRETHQGIGNAHRIAILEQGLTYKEASYNQRDMQFAELRELSAEFVRAAFAFPKPMLGAVDDVNRANADAGEYMFGKWLIHPRAERIKGVLNARFLPLFGATSKGLEFDYDPVVPDDESAESAVVKTRAEAVKVLVDAGFDRAEALVVVGLPPMNYTAPALAPATDPTGVPA